jgi:hypothetical protein
MEFTMDEPVHSKEDQWDTQKQDEYRNHTSEMIDECLHSRMLARGEGEKETITISERIGFRREEGAEVAPPRAAKWFLDILSYDTKYVFSPCLWKRKC